LYPASWATPNLPPRPPGDWSYIYGLFDPAEQVIRYVGRAVKPRIRLCEHLKADDTEMRYPYKHWVASLYEQDRVPCMIILEVCEASLAGVKEYEWYHRATTAGDVLNTRPIVTPGKGKIRAARDMRFDQLNYPQFAIIEARFDKYAEFAKHFSVFDPEEKLAQKYAKMIAAARELALLEVCDVSLPPELWAHVDAQAGGNRSERLRVVVGRDMELSGLAEDERLSRYYDWYYSVGIGGE
jgi:hypothetical protein